MASILAGRFRDRSRLHSPKTKRLHGRCGPWHPDAMDKIDAHTVGHHLNLSADLIAWLGRPRSSSPDLSLPNDAEATSWFARLEIPPDMWREILKNRPCRTTNPAVHWLMQRACADVIDNMGSG